MASVAPTDDQHRRAVPASLLKAGRQLAQARSAQRQALDGARTEALAALAGGLTEVTVARVLGVDRMTVRKWQGKGGRQDPRSAARARTRSAR